MGVVTCDMLVGLAQFMSPGYLAFNGIILVANKLHVSLFFAFMNFYLV